MVKTLRGEHVRELDTHTPYPVPGLEQALGVARSTVAWWALGGGVIGAAGAWALQRPTPLPVAFQLSLLGAALTLVGALVVKLWGFPRLHHPVFEHAPFVQTASSSGFWVSVSTRVAEDAERAKGRLEALGAKNVAVIVEPEEPR